MIRLKAGRVASALVLGLFFLSGNLSTAFAADQDAIAEAASGMTLRSIGPALMGGRIADIAIHPYKGST